MDKETALKSLEIDKTHIWHPYTSMTDPLPAYLIESGHDALLTLADGKELVDGMSSWWCAIHGYNHPKLNRALRAQAGKISHVMFGGVTHKPAITLAEKLLKIVPDNLKHIFYADSGSVAVEVAIKMALQYRQARGEVKRTKLLTVRGGYHGDTFGAMSVCDPIGGMHHLFTDILPKHHFVNRPICRFGSNYDAYTLDEMRVTLRDHGGEITAVILEPIVQGAGGMWFYHPEYLKGVRTLCDEFGVLLILDEIATGFGRTGKLFACEWADIKPDIMCVGKALTGGYMTLAATLATTEVAHEISADGGVFNHGPTFMANPLACAVAGASLDLIIEGEWIAQTAQIERGLREGLMRCHGLAGVADVRVLGAIGVVEMEEPVNVSSIQAYFIDKGVWIRPFGNLIYLMPPYIVTQEETAKLTSAIYDAIAAGVATS